MASLNSDLAGQTLPRRQTDNLPSSLPSNAVKRVLYRLVKKRKAVSKPLKGAFPASILIKRNFEKGSPPMFSKSLIKRILTFSSRIYRLAFFAAAIAVLCFAVISLAQNQQQGQTQQPANDQQNQQNPNQNSTGEAGGPKGDIGPIAVPRKPDAE